MGWDLTPVDEDVEPFHVARNSWPRIVFNAPSFTGAEMRSFSDTPSTNSMPPAINNRIMFGCFLTPRFEASIFPKIRIRSMTFRPWSPPNSK